MTNLMPEDLEIWEFVEHAIRKCASLYNFKEIRTPVLQPIDLYKKYSSFSQEHGKHTLDNALLKINDEQDICLRHEGILPILNTDICRRAMTEPQKIYYYGPMFKKDLHSNSFTQYNQVGAEILGSESIISDIETIQLAKSFFKILDVSGITLEINSNGCPKCHKHYLKALYDFIRFNKDNICGDCHQSVKKYPLCIFKCPDTQCQSIRNMAPKTLDYLCPDCLSHFKELKKMLTNLGTSFVINQNLAMDFDYYNRLVFQFTIKNENDEKVVLASGGRYDALATYITKKPLSAIGSSCIIDNYIELVKEKKKLPPKKHPFSVGICSVSTSMELLIMQVAQETLSHDINTVILEHTISQDDLEETIKKHKCNIFLVFKEDLIQEGKIMITYLDQHHDKSFQDNIPLADIMENINRIKKHYSF